MLSSYSAAEGMVQLVKKNKFLRGIVGFLEARIYFFFGRGEDFFLGGEKLER